MENKIEPFIVNCSLMLYMPAWISYNRSSQITLKQLQIRPQFACSGRGLYSRPLESSGDANVKAVINPQTTLFFFQQLAVVVFL